MAYFATALLTIGAIVLAYFTDSLPTWYTNELDRRVISHSYRKLPTWIRKTPRGQQLVTGLAILIGALAQQCQVKILEFQIAVALAWFSTTTHLATLIMLREYFVKHPIVRRYRIAGILAILILLFFSLMASQIIGSGMYPGVPLQCIFLGSPVPQSASKKFCPTLHDIQYLSYGYTKFSASFSILLPVFTTVSLVSTYVYAMVQLRHKTGDETAARRFFVVAYLRFFVPHSNELRSRGMLQKQTLDALVANSMAKRRISRLKSMEQTRAPVRLCSGLHYFYPSSFLSTFTSVAFTFSHGVTSTIVARWNSTVAIAANSNTVDFGQLVFLLLLAIPFLTAIEAVYGKYCLRRFELHSADLG